MGAKSVGTCAIEMEPPPGLKQHKTENSRLLQLINKAHLQLGRFWNLASDGYQTPSCPNLWAPQRPGTWWQGPGKPRMKEGLQPDTAQPSPRCPHCLPPMDGWMDWAAPFPARLGAPWTWPCRHRVGVQDSLCRGESGSFTWIYTREQESRTTSQYMWLLLKQ